MAKRDDYPQNKSLRARIDCVLRSHSAMRSLLRSVNEFVLPVLPEKLAKTIKEQLEEALAGADLAGSAVSGFDD